MFVCFVANCSFKQCLAVYTVKPILTEHWENWKPFLTRLIFKLSFVLTCQVQKGFIIDMFHCICINISQGFKREWKTLSRQKANTYHILWVSIYTYLSALIEAELSWGNERPWAGKRQILTQNALGVNCVCLSNIELMIGKWASKKWGTAI